MTHNRRNSEQNSEGGLIQQMNKWKTIFITQRINKKNNFLY